MQKPTKNQLMTDTKKVLTLGDRLLNYIALHNKGIKVSEMEEPFGVTRMKIGYVIKKLLEEGKVKKIRNQYYPIEEYTILNSNF